MRAAKVNFRLQFKQMLNAFRRVGGTDLPKREIGAIARDLHVFMQILMESTVVYQGKPVSRAYREKVRDTIYELICYASFMERLALNMGYNHHLGLWGQQLIQNALQIFSADQKMFPIGVIGADFSNLKLRNTRYGPLQTDQLLNSLAVTIEDSLYLPRGSAIVTRLDHHERVKHERRIERRPCPRVTGQAQKGDEIMVLVMLNREQRQWSREEILHYLFRLIRRVKRNLHKPEAGVELVVREGQPGAGNIELVHPEAEFGAEVLMNPHDFNYLDVPTIWQSMEQRYIHPLKTQRNERNDRFNPVLSISRNRGEKVSSNVA